MTPLCELARKHETDKGGQHLRYGGGDSDTNHNYTPVYHYLFNLDIDPHKWEVRNVLEIGVHHGSSLRMWKEYFPHANILGLDTNIDCLRWAEDRIIVRMADQNNPDQLRAAVYGSKFDLIVDDGSHERQHQITSMTTLLPYLEDWGYYVIEDIGTMPQLPLELVAAVPPDYEFQAVYVTGGLGPKVQPGEWLMIVKRRPV